MCSIKLLFGAFWLLLVISVSSSTYLTDDDLRKCGDSLAQSLESVCVNGYNKIRLRDKKSNSLSSLTELADENDDQSFPLSALFKDEFYANYNNLIAKVRRRRYQGVADECCLKSCSVSELTTYCL